MAFGEATCGKVVLLNPPTAAPSNTILLNLGYLSAALKKAGHEPLVIDATAPHARLTEEEVFQRIRQFAPVFVGVTLTINHITDTYAFLGRLRGLGLPIVCGGPHANCLPAEVLEGGADIVAVGEGEITVVELTDCLLRGGSLEEVDGLCYRDGAGQARYTTPRTLLADLDTLPKPDFASFPIERYTGSPSPDSHATFWSLFTSRGCPFNCTFCSSHSVFGRKFRARSPQNILEECVALNKHFGAMFFAFQDDEAFINKKRIIEFCRKVREGGHQFGFSSRLRIDSVTADLLTEMKSAGFKRIGFGIDSWHDDSLRRVNKSYKVHEVLARFDVVASIGIPAVYFGIIAGFPWETREYFRIMLENIAKIHKDVLYFPCIVTPIPYPKTKLYDDHHEEFGFTRWWMDPAINSMATSKTLTTYGCDEKHLPFFLDYCNFYSPLYLDEPYWRLGEEMVSALEWFSWGLFALSLRRMVNYPEYLFIFWGSRLSRSLWRCWPRLESIVFKLPRLLGAWLGLPEKTNYVKRSK